MLRQCRACGARKAPDAFRALGAGRRRTCRECENRRRRERGAAARFGADGPLPEGLRRCKACGLAKVLDAFRVVRSFSQGKVYRRETCLVCENRARRERRRGKPDRRDRKGRRRKAWTPGPLSKVIKARRDYLRRIRLYQARLAQIEAEIVRLTGEEIADDRTRI